MANIEKHRPHLAGRYINNRRGGRPMRAPVPAERAQATVLRLEHLPATPGNLERIRERVEAWNRRLAETGTPFRLRLL